MRNGLAISVLAIVCGAIAQASRAGFEREFDAGYASGDGGQLGVDGGLKVTFTGGTQGVVYTGEDGQRRRTARARLSIFFAPYVLAQSVSTY